MYQMQHKATWEKKRVNCSKKTYAQKSVLLILLFLGSHIILCERDEHHSLICNVRANPKIKYLFPDQFYILRSNMDLFLEVIDS